MKDTNKLIIITGPTGIGKTTLSIELAKILDTEIISADSMQIYKYMDIGTGKVTEEESQGIKHHMLDIVYPNEDYTVDDYKKDASSIVESLNLNNKIPIIVGGTGLYLESLIYKLDFNIAKPNQHLRDYYNKLSIKHGPGYLHNILSKVDPISADRIHPNQEVRIIRALEVFDQTSKPFSSYNDYNREYRDKLSFKYIVLNRDREELYERINKRVDIMLSNGLVDEVKDLLDKGYGKDLTSMQGIGYKEIISYIENELNYDEAIDLLKRNSRRYAKRQLTWFRREPSKIILDIERNDNLDKIINKCLKMIKGD